MDDLISRQAAIDTLDEWESSHSWDAWCYEHKNEAKKFHIDAPTAVIENLPSAQQWIPCSERLPEEEDTYIVAFDKKCLRKDEMQVSDAIWKDNQWQYGMLESFENRMPRFVIEPIKELRIIAWMPLPEPYKEGEE